MTIQSVETANQSSDKLKITLAIIVIAAGIFAYSYFSELAIYARIGMFIGGLVVAALIVGFSQTGHRFFGFLTGSVNEVKRVVWPTRKETLQMTGIVFAFVIIMSIFLWVVDKLLEWVIYSVLLGWN